MLRHVAFCTNYQPKWPSSGTFRLNSSDFITPKIKSLASQEEELDRDRNSTVIKL